MARVPIGAGKFPIIAIITPQRFEVIKLALVRNPARTTGNQFTFTKGGKWELNLQSDGSSVYLPHGNVGIYVNDPQYPLHAVTQAGSGRAIYGEASSDGGFYTAAEFDNSEDLNPKAVFGFASGTSGLNYGVYGLSHSNTGRGVYYTWDAEHGGQHDVGFIAEEVGEVIPELVQYEENGVDAIGLDYSKVTPLLVEALNALREEKDVEIDELLARLEILEARINELEGLAP